MTGCAGGEALAAPLIFSGPRADNTARTERDLRLTLARAFMAPTDPAMARAMRTGLADDLDEMLSELGIDAAGAVAALRATLARLPGDEALLVHYSGLFLPPAIKARLNLCQYLDGAIGGAGRDALDAWFARAGLAPRADFHDLPDHLTMLLEFMAMLDPEAGAAFARAFLLPAVPRLEAQIAEHDADSPYRHLVRIVLAMLAAFALPEERDGRRERAEKRADTELGVWRACKVCGKRYARAKEIVIMTAALEQAGLPAGHLDTCPGCRDPVKGGVARTGPAGG